MNYLIDVRSLELLLEKRKDYITGAVSCGSIITGASWVITGMTAEFVDLPIEYGRIIRHAMICLGAIGIIYGIVVALRNKNMFYNHNKLFSEMKELDKTGHRFSIVIIKDTYNSFPNHYLVRYVKDWDCKLFFSFRTQDADNENNIATQLSNMLHVNREHISVEYKTQDYTTKYSVKDKCTKTYDHQFYVATITDFPDSVKEQDFVIDDVHYYWMSYEKMIEDKRIREVNRDIVDFVHDHVN